MSQSFYEQVYVIVRQIPEGQVTSYGRIAQMLWSPRASRAVGYALRALKFRREEPEYQDIPWHRVVNQKGIIRVHEPGATDCLQAELLREEGVSISKELQVDMKKHLWEGLSSDVIEDLLVDWTEEEEE